MNQKKQKQIKQISEPQAIDKRQSYENGQNSDLAYVQSSRPRILQTISEQALSEGKGSISNRSESAQNTNRIRKNLSHQNINNHRSSSFLNNLDHPIRTMSHSIDSSQYSNRLRGVQELHSFDKQAASTHRINEVYGHARYQCYQCPLYLNKIVELQNSYELLLLAKNQELQECRIVIKGLEQKLKQIEKRSMQQIEKNKKFRTQMERKNTQENYHRQRQNQMIEYLKNRQIILLEQMKEMENKIYIKDIKSRDTDSANKSSSYRKGLQFDSKGFSSATNNKQFNPRSKRKQNIVEFDQNRSISQCSAKTFEQQFEMNQNVLNGNLQFLSENGKHMSAKNNGLYSSSGTRMAVELIQRVPLSQILKKTNQIECLRDNLLVSELKIKIQQTKSLENLLMTK